MLSYVLSQVCVSIAMGTLGASYFVKKRNIILILNVICSLFFSLSYLFLGAYAACFINAFGIVRIAWFYFDDKKEKTDYVSLIVICVCLFAGGIWTYRLWPDALVIVQGLIFTYSLWQKNVSVYLWIAPISNSLYVVYNIAYRSLLGSIFQIVLFILSVIALIRLIMNKNKKNEIINDKLEENVEGGNL